MSMKPVALVALLPFVAFARTVTVSSLPPNEYADTEVSTNISFVLKSRQLDTAWNLVKVTRRGCGAACELVKAEGRKPGFRLEVR